MANVGEVRYTFTGDASKLRAEIARVQKDLEKLQATAAKGVNVGGGGAGSKSGLAGTLGGIAGAAALGGGGGAAGRVLGNVLANTALLEGLKQAGLAIATFTTQAGLAVPIIAALATATVGLIKIWGAYQDQQFEVAKTQKLVNKQFEDQADILRKLDPKNIPGFLDQLPDLDELRTKLSALNEELTKLEKKGDREGAQRVREQITAVKKLVDTIEDAGIRVETAIKKMDEAITHGGAKALQARLEAERKVISAIEVGKEEELRLNEKATREGIETIQRLYKGRVELEDRLSEFLEGQANERVAIEVRATEKIKKLYQDLGRSIRESQAAISQERLSQQEQQIGSRQNIAEITQPEGPGKVDTLLNLTIEKAQVAIQRVMEGISTAVEEERIKFEEQFGQLRGSANPEDRRLLEKAEEDSMLKREAIVVQGSTKIQAIEQDTVESRIAAEEKKRQLAYTTAQAEIKAAETVAAARAKLVQTQLKAEQQAIETTGRLEEKRLQNAAELIVKEAELAAERQRAVGNVLGAETTLRDGRLAGIRETSRAEETAINTRIALIRKAAEAEQAAYEATIAKIKATIESLSVARPGETSDQAKQRLADLTAAEIALTEAEIAHTAAVEESSAALESNQEDLDQLSKTTAQAERGVNQMAEAATRATQPIDDLGEAARKSSDQLNNTIATYSSAAGQFLEALAEARKRLQDFRNPPSPAESRRRRRRELEEEIATLIRNRPRIGGFISADPLGLAVGANMQTGLKEPAVPGPPSAARRVTMHGGERGMTPHQESQIIHQLERLERSESGGGGGGGIQVNVPVTINGVVGDDVLRQIDRRLAESVRRGASEAYNEMTRRGTR